jgi:glycosyltransferase involved in cell wall biosynthesis
MASLPKDSNLKLVVLGDGELRETLLTKCLLLNLRSFSIWDKDQWNENFDVYFLGHQNNPYPYLKHATLYVMTSLWEGFPLSLCEALACGLPVLAADCATGPREILCPELPLGEPLLAPYISTYGVLMPIPNSNRQINIWSHTISTIIGDKELRAVLSTSAQKRVRDFDKSNVEDQWLKVLFI